MENAHWDDADHALFASVIKLAPDTAPCDLAVICRKSCIEMYVARLRTIPDTAVHSAPNPKAKPKKPSIKFVEDTLLTARSAVLTPHPAGPCAHAGPCSRDAVDCVCAAREQHCMRTCRCGPTCAAPSASPAAGVNPPSTNPGRARPARGTTPWRCGWGRRGREESVRRRRLVSLQGARAGVRSGGVCGVWGAVRAHGKCRNRSLQQGESHPIHVKTSKFGLGAFAVSTIPKDACVGEYVGEIAEDDVPDLSRLQHHVKLNYAFELSQAYDAHARALPGTERIIDSWNLGNATRFLNYGMANARGCGNFCANTMPYVHRIGIYALIEIKAGTELTLDYGEAYWAVTPPESRHY
ncbi:hypothetical protein HYPSUDRAFT_39850, partial [Hypholoma sublateritium FD-334 SS-4]